MRALLLASGGIDSTTSWWILQQRDWEVLPLFIDYGQPSATHEWNAVTALARVAGADALRYSVPSPYPTFPPYALLPARNLLLLAIAIAYAASREMRAIAVGSNADDAVRGDGSPAFRRTLERLAVLTPPRIRILAPVGRHSKREVVRLARAISAPIQASVSCYSGLAGGCGACRGCHDRARALANDGMDIVS